jgi:lysophospholipase
MIMRERDNSVDKEMIFLGEEDYMDKMLHIVAPILSKYRTTDYFNSSDGTKIYYEAYLHPEEKAAVVISHGFCEFTAKFEEVVFYFLQAGYSVYILDHRGHGYSARSVSDKSKVYVRSYEEYVLDFHVFITKVVLKDSLHRRLVLYAHSMGGAIAALYLEQYPGVFSCAILSSPMLEINSGIVPKSVVWLVMLFKKLTRTDEDYVTRHKKFDGIPIFTTSSCLSEARYNHIFSKRLEDENYQTYGASSAWTLASMNAVKKLQKQAGLVKTPILLIQAGKDTTVRPGGQKRFARKSQNTRLVIMPDSKHEIYNADTKTRTEYYQKIIEYLEEQIK